MPKTRRRKHVVEMTQSNVSENGESVVFGFRAEDGSITELSASADAVEVILYNIEQLAITALRRRLELGTDRGVAPKDIPAFRSVCDGFALEEAEPTDNFEGYRLLAFRLSRPPIMMLLNRKLFEELSLVLVSPLEKTQAKKH
jgi:hypothetical protein